ncbi:hypothetical protein F2Q70_00020230 [Brassica cretica]|uniref:Uncharacterized protein n=1 Tax=Brassica cretica TaxID=69181 RepID=A0A8S9GXR4_BRACR|nr:hypothetical protein F2Q70_00020230 [Brassica cretica]
MRSEALDVDDNTSYDDFVNMVIKEYKVNEQIYDVELSYMFPKKVLLTLPQNTPPVDINNQRQFTGFLEQLKTEAMQVCLELKERVLEEDEDASDDEDKCSIFDYCDDLDGASSGDEDFALNGIHAEEEETEEEEKIMKGGFTSASVP